MSKEIITFGDMKIENNRFYSHKISTFLKDVDIEKVLLSNKISFGKEKAINTLLVTCIIMIKLSLYV